MVRCLLLLLSVVALGACNASPITSQSNQTQSTAPTQSNRTLSAAPSQSNRTPGTTGTPRPTATPRVTPAPTPLPSAKLTEWPPGAIGTAAAKDNVGKTMTVCGAVVSAEWTQAVKGSPTFLNLDVAYPSPRFNVVIWLEQRREWLAGEKPETTLPGRTICVTGLIEAYRGIQQIAGASFDSITIVPGT